MGSHEPDAWDADAMFATSDTSPDPAARDVYFNGFLSSGYATVGGEGINPNTNAATTTIITPQPTPRALLGVWKDCNADGYVGALFSAQVDEDQSPDQYPSALADPSICPVGTGVGAYNDGTWVTEMFPIVLVPGSEPEFSRWGILDRAARVWFDAGRPDDPVS